MRARDSIKLCWAHHVYMIVLVYLDYPTPSQRSIGSTLKVASAYIALDLDITRIAAAYTMIQGLPLIPTERRARA